MNYPLFGALLFTVAATLSLSSRAADPADKRCYELRVYYAAPGKLDALNARFRDHTTKLFAKHGMTNLGYWMPIENPDSKLYYILAYPDRPARDKSWAAFLADPEWKRAAAESEKDGKLVSKVESSFLHATDYSPAIQPRTGEPEHVYELRIYTTTPGNLDRLNARFRNHTVELFSKHGMEHLGYWLLDAGQKGADDTLIYLLHHKSPEAAQASFAAFRDDPAWQAARAASEKEAGGSLTTPDGVKSLFMKPTDYSPSR